MNIFFCFDALTCRSIYDPDDRSTLVGLSDDDLERIGGGCVNAAHLRHLLNPGKNIDGISAPQKYEKDVARAHSKCLFFSASSKLIIVSATSDETGTARLTKGEAKLGSGNRAYNRLVKVLHCLDEVALAQNCVGITWRAKLDYFELQLEVHLLTVSFLSLSTRLPSRSDTRAFPELSQKASTPGSRVPTRPWSQPGQSRRGRSEPSCRTFL